MTDIESDGVPVLRLTDAALTKVLELRASEGSKEPLALWVQVSGTSGNAYTYDMYFEAAVDANPPDWSEEREGLVIVVPAESVAKMRGSVLDLSRDLLQGGMVIQNPNTPPLMAASPAMSGPPADLSGDVAQRVMQVLEHQINPSIAAHGGRADLVAVNDDAAYLRLSGGCAGCGMAAVTLSQGIEVAIHDSVPEIARVIDVTDHAAGTNPYYEPAKK
ncbi:MAG TPA: NifU family protein [Acidimicrobiales bacterium]|nr:NifU family protein [Acidimicrobiales bacterium]